MSDRIKQRLVGGLVLVALAVVFLPVVFNFEPRRPLDQTSQIPPAPEVAPVEVNEPREPAVTSEPPAHEEAFQPEATPSDDPLAQESSADPTAKEVSPEVPEAEEIREAAGTEESSDAPDTTPPKAEPQLAESGLPEAWVVQAASYRYASGAEAMAGRLKEAGFKAFVRSAEVDGARMHRVFVGPLVLKKRAEEQKARIDASLEVDSLVLPYEP